MKILKLIFLALFVPCLTVHSQNANTEQGTLMDINGTSLFVKTVGNGEPIIVIHGGPVLDHSYLFPHLKPLMEGYRLIFFDQRLSGRSSAVADSSDIRLSTFIEDIEALRTELKLQKVHILGHSWGGLLAMKYAIAYPSHINNLMLINSMAPTSELWQEEEAVLAASFTEADSLQRQEIIQSELFSENPPQAIKKLLELSFKKQFFDAEKADLLDLYVPDDYMARSRLFSYLMADISNYDLQDELQNLTIPTLIVYGDSEPAAEISGPVLNRLLPNSSYTIIDHSGHFPFIEQPEKFRQTVISFLNES